MSQKGIWGPCGLTLRLLSYVASPPRPLLWSSRHDRPPGYRPARRRLARRVHLGRARPAAAGAAVRDRRHQRNERRRDERGDSRRRAAARRRCRGAKALERYWNDVGRCPAMQLRTASGVGRAAHLEPGAQPCLPVARHALAYLVALPDQSIQLQPAAQPARANRFRRPASGSQGRARVFICATNVRTGLRRVFENEELSADVLLASPPCRRSTRRWRSTASTTGTAATPAIRRWRRSTSVRKRAT